MVGILSRPADPKRRDVLETGTADRTSESTARYQNLRGRVVGAAANDPRRFLVRSDFSEAPARHKKWTSPEMVVRRPTRPYRTARDVSLGTSPSDSVDFYFLPGSSSR